jgi:hypothetical protein
MGEFSISKESIFFLALSTLDKAKDLSPRNGIRTKLVLIRGMALCRVFNPIKINNPFAGVGMWAPI